MTRQALFSSRVGNRWSFAVEFEAFSELPRKWNEWWGSLWLWVDGHVVGRPFDIEMVMSGFDPLVEALYQAEQNAGNPASALLASLDYCPCSGDGADVLAKSIKNKTKESHSWLCCSKALWHAN